MAVVAFLLWRRSRARPLALTDDRVQSTFDPAVPPPPAPAPSPPPTPAHARPTLSVRFTPKRAGLNLTGAAIDYHLVLRNDGDAPARDVRVGLSVLTANPAQEIEIDRTFGAPIEQPVLAAFPLAPGEEVALEGMAMLPQANVQPVTVADRRLVAPFFLANILYKGTSGEGGQVAGAWLVGIDRGADARLGPFLVDQGPRMHAQVTAREHRALKR